jgi:hypothetical protein
MNKHSNSFGPFVSSGANVIKLFPAVSYDLRHWPLSPIAKKLFTAVIYGFS